MDDVVQVVPLHNSSTEEGVSKLFSSAWVNYEASVIVPNLIKTSNWDHLSTTNTDTRADGSHLHRTQYFNNKKPVIPNEYGTTAYSGTKQ